MAAGFSIDEKNLEALRQGLNNYAESTEFSVPKFHYVNPNVKIDFDEINDDTMTWLQRFEPFGTGNTAPLFYSKNVIVYMYAR